LQSKVGCDTEFIAGVFEQGQEILFCFLPKIINLKKPLPDLSLLVQLHFDSVDYILEHLEDGLLAVISVPLLHIDGIADLH
jgi:hypothetical protein